MRALFASTRGAGHVGPLLPLADACVRAGHEVFVAGPDELADAIARAGHEHWRLDTPPADELEAVWSRVPSLSPDEQNVVVVRDVFATLNVRAALPRLQEACSAWRPDVVVREPNEYASAIAADLHGLPHVRVAIGLASSEELGLQIAAEAVDAMRRAAGLPPDPHGRSLRRSPYLTAFPAALEDPDVAPQPDTRRYRDPAWDAPAAPLPGWWEHQGLPLVYVTFGSVAGSFAAARAIYDVAMTALAELPVRGLLTTGDGPDVAALAASAPPNVHVERWVPQADVLPHAAAIVSHAGSGTTLGALAAGVPHVAVPLFADQPANAERVAAIGAGIAVPPDADAIENAVAQVLGHDRYAERARAVAEELRGHPPVDTVVEALAHLAVAAG